MARFCVWIATAVCASAAVAQEPIRIGAWNIEVLGSPFDRDYPEHRASSGYGVARDPRGVADQIEAMNLDVLAVSEIDDDDQGDEGRNNSVLDAAFAELNQRPGNDWEYVLFAGRWRDFTDQLTGIAWNREKVTAVGRPMRVAVRDLTTDRFAEWHRTPHAMKFQRAEGRTDFVVVPIHMKAGAGADEIEQRRLEAESLLAELGEIRAHFEDEDIVLIGDFNFRGQEGVRPRDEPAGRAYRGAGLFDLNYQDRGTHITGWALDRCYIPRSQRENEFEGVERIQILVPDDRQAFRRMLSDHWPIVVQLLERADDDGE